MTLYIEVSSVRISNAREFFNLILSAASISDRLAYSEEIETNGLTCAMEWLITNKTGKPAKVNFIGSN